jgi:hypothetical protein
MFTQEFTAPPEHQHLLQIIAEKDEELRSLQKQLKNQAWLHFA